MTIYIECYAIKRTMLVDVKSLTRNTLLITDDQNTQHIVTPKPYIYSVKKLRQGIPLEKVTKKVIWSKEDVTTYKTVFQEQRRIWEILETVKTPIFEFDLNPMVRYVLDAGESRPQKVTGAVYDIETSGKAYNFERAAFAPITIDKQGFVTSKPTEIVKNPGDLIEILCGYEAVIGHYMQWFDNKVMSKYDRHKFLYQPRIRNPLSKWGQEQEPAVLLKHAMNIDTIPLAHRFVLNPPGYSLKILTQFLKLGELKYVSPGKMASVPTRILDEYVTNDVDVTVELAKRLMPELWAAWKILKVPPTIYLSLPGKGSLDSAMIAMARRFPQYYIPAKEYNTKYEGEYANPQAGKYMDRAAIGGYNFNPDQEETSRKFYTDIHGMDFKGAYPEYLIAENIGFELPESETETKLHGVLIGHRATDIAGKVYDSISGKIAPMAVYVKPQPQETVQTAIVKELNKETEYYRDLAKKDPTYSPIYIAVKGTFRNNMTHGILCVRRPVREGIPCLSGSRFINYPAASAITNAIRLKIYKASEITRKYGKILYGDTDSIYFIAQKKPAEEILKMCEVATGLKLDLEHMQHAYFVSGKNYAYIDDNDHLTLKGATIKGKDKSQVVIKVLRKVIKRILKTQRINRRQILRDIDEIIDTEFKKTFEDDSNLFNFSILVSSKQDYKAEHLQNIAAYFKREYGQTENFLGIVVGKRTFEALKPQATIKHHKKIKPLEFTEPGEINLNWYKWVTRKLIEQFFDIPDLKKGE